MIVTGSGAGGAALAPLHGPDPLPIPEVRSSESSTLPCVVDTPANFSSRGEFLSSCMRNSGRVCQAFDSFALCRGRCWQPVAYRESLAKTSWMEFVNGVESEEGNLSS